MATDRLPTAATRVRGGLLGLAAAVPMLAAGTLLVYLIVVDPKQSVKLHLWGRLLQVLMLAWLVYFADIALDRRRRLGLPSWQEYVPARPAGRTGEPPG